MAKKQRPRTGSRNTEVTVTEGEVCGHFIKFVEEKVRPFHDGSKGGAELRMPPKIMCGVVVEVDDGQDRIPINVREHEEPLPNGTVRAKVTKKAKTTVYRAISKAYPLTTVVQVRCTRYTDNNWKKFELVD